MIYGLRSAGQKSVLFSLEAVRIMGIRSPEDFISLIVRCSISSKEIIGVYFFSAKIKAPSQCPPRNPVHCTNLMPVKTLDQVTDKHLGSFFGFFSQIFQFRSIPYFRQHGRLVCISHDNKIGHRNRSGLFFNSQFLP